MFRYLLSLRFPFAARHPVVVWAAIFIPSFLIANAILAALGAPKSPHDIALVLRNVMVMCVLGELALAAYRRLNER